MRRRAPRAKYATLRESGDQNGQIAPSASGHDRPLGIGERPRLEPVERSDDEAGVAPLDAQRENDLGAVGRDLGWGERASDFRLAVGDFEMWEPRGARLRPGAADEPRGENRG